MASIIHNTVLTTVFETDLGWMGATWSRNKLQNLTFGHPNEHSLRSETAHIPSYRGRWTPCQQSVIDRLQVYATGKFVDFQDVLITLDAFSTFEQAVIQQCRRIPYGETRTYAELACSSGYPRAARATGNVMAKNRVPLIVPCHRVVRSGNGNFGRYSARGGTNMKTRLLMIESAKHQHRQPAEGTN